MSIKKPLSEGEPLDVSEKLGKTIKRLRNAYNYSLGDLSEQSGVAKSIISQIEKNETNPTLSTLFKLSRALNSPIEDMLKGDDSPALVEKLGPSGTPLLVSDDGKCRLRIVGWIKVIELVQTYYFEADEGGVLDSDPHPTGSVENLTILQGQVEVAVGDEKYMLNVGETARYRADRPHRIVNTGVGKASAIMVNLLGPVAAAGQSLRMSGD
ncbi:MAG: helix-turn-helix transcriptional regulator [Chitinophagales bacterium]|nr:helix-turn-helix transcriptional regulator [Hyphomicrobiales bacterium]